MSSEMISRGADAIARLVFVLVLVDFAVPAPVAPLALFRLGTRGLLLLGALAARRIPGGAGRPAAAVTARRAGAEAAGAWRAEVAWGAAGTGRAWAAEARPWAAEAATGARGTTWTRGSGARRSRAAE